MATAWAYFKKTVKDSCHLILPFKVEESDRESLVLSKNQQNKTKKSKIVFCYGHPGLTYSSIIHQPWGFPMCVFNETIEIVKRNECGEKRTDSFSWNYIYVKEKTSMCTKIDKVYSPTWNIKSFTNTANCMKQ